MNRTSIGSKTEHPPAGATTPGEKTASTSPTRSKRDRCLFDSGEKEQRLALRVSSSRCPFCQVLNMAVCVGRFWNAGCMIQQRLCKQCKGAAVRISHRYLRCCLAKYRVQIRCTTWTWLPNGYVALLYTTEAQADRATRDSRTSYTPMPRLLPGPTIREAVIQTSLPIVLAAGASLSSETRRRRVAVFAASGAITALKTGIGRCQTAQARLWRSSPGFPGL